MSCPHAEPDYIQKGNTRFDSMMLKRVAKNLGEINEWISRYTKYVHFGTVCKWFLGVECYFIELFQEFSNDLVDNNNLSFCLYKLGGTAKKQENIIHAILIDAF